MTMRLKKVATKRPSRLRRMAPDIQLGRNVKIFAFVNLYGCKIGDNTKIGTFVDIQKGAKIGLHLAMISCGVGSGDEVITVPFTFIATAWAISYVGAKPVFVDIEPNAYTMEMSQVEKAITSRTRAILPVHLYGQTADMNPLKEICQRHNLALIEDAAQAHGAEYFGQRAGSIGRVGCLSFYPTKNLGAFGERG